MSEAVRCQCIVVRSGADAIALLGQQNLLHLPVVPLPHDAWPPDEAAAIILDAWQDWSTADGGNAYMAENMAC